MATDTNQPTDVLHSETHSKLSAEEIAKAVARHNNKHHSGAKPDNATPKTKKTGKK
jgi:hypothetical protein